jgi:LysR family nitrogen assimilation transcriptional regulator
MDLRQLRYFIKVVDCLNITRASEALHIAQPAISQQMRNLESDLGMQLLERSANGVAPTAAGQTLYRHALELLRQADDTGNLLRQDAENPQGKVSVGMPSSTARMLAMPLARTVGERYPGIVLELTEAPSADIEKLVSVGRVDLAVVADHVETRGVAAQWLIRETLYLLAWPDFTIAHDPVSLAELARMPLILPSAPNVIRNRIDWALHEAGLSCSIRCEASTTALLLAAVVARLGVTILPWSAMSAEVEARTIKLARIDHRLFARDLSLCWHDTQRLSNGVQKVKAIVLELFEQLGRRPEWGGGA